MPDQPEDPLDYEMKIPPETHPSKHESHTEPPSSDEKEDTAKDTNVVRGDDKPQKVRPTE